MRLALASFSSPLRAAVTRRLSSYRLASKSLPRSFASASAAAAIVAAGAAFYAYSSRAETAHAPPPATDAAALEAAAASRAGKCCASFCVFLYHFYTLLITLSLFVTFVTFQPGTVLPGLPDFTLQQVSQHKTSADRIWVTYRNAVYDVTEFVENHPGGMKRIMLAGASLSVFL